jgi:hypothetical protein
LERLTVVLNSGELDNPRRRVVETSNAERLEHHFEAVKGSCQVDHSVRKGRCREREVKGDGEAVVIPNLPGSSSELKTQPAKPETAPQTWNPSRTWVN